MKLLFDFIIDKSYLSINLNTEVPWTITRKTKKVSDWVFWGKGVVATNSTLWTLLIQQ